MSIEDIHCLISFFHYVYALFLILCGSLIHIHLKLVKLSVTIQDCTTFMCPFSVNCLYYIVRLSSSGITIIPQATPVTDVQVFSKINQSGYLLPFIALHCMWIGSTSFFSFLFVMLTVMSTFSVDWRTGWKSRWHWYHSNSCSYNWSRLWSRCNCGGDHLWW